MINFCYVIDGKQVINLACLFKAEKYDNMDTEEEEEPYKDEEPYKILMYFYDVPESESNINVISFITDNQRDHEFGKLCEFIKSINHQENIQ